MVIHLFPFFLLNLILFTVLFDDHLMIWSLLLLFLFVHLHISKDVYLSMINLTNIVVAIMMLMVTIEKYYC